MPNRVMEFSFPRQPVRAIRVVQTAGPSPEQWSITDLRVVPPVPIQRLHSDPNPWELPLAFDGKPVTRWRTWLPLERGQWVEVDLGQPQMVEGVTLQCTRDQPSVRLEVQGENASGQWRRLSAAPREREIAPIQNLRRMAAGELKSRGVDYLLVFGSDPGADDFKLHAQEWGIRQVGELGDDRLYRIE
jgi:F5/8 type C domain